MKSNIIVTEENETWSAHDPNVPGVYGLGPTREAAMADLSEARALLGEYDASQADDEDEDAEDVRLADASLAEVRAGGATFTHEQMLQRYGIAPPVKVGIVSDIHGDIVSLDLALGHLRGMGCTTILCPGDLLERGALRRGGRPADQGRGRGLHPGQPRAVGVGTLPPPAGPAQVSSVYCRAGRPVHRRCRAVPRGSGLACHPALPLVRRAGGRARGDVARAAGQRHGGDSSRCYRPNLAATIA